MPFEDMEMALNPHLRLRALGAEKSREAGIMRSVDDAYARALAQGLLGYKADDTIDPRFQQPTVNPQIDPNIFVNPPSALRAPKPYGI